MRHIGRVLAIALMAAGATAQTTLVSPGIFKDHAGNTSRSYIFRPSSTASYRQARFMQIHDLNLSKAGTIKGMAFRWYAGSNYYYHLPFQATLELTLSTAPTSASSISPTFASNVGKDATVVISKKAVNFPPKLTYGSFPNPFMYRLPFDSGKSFTLAAGKSLCWDIKVYDNDLYAKGNPYIYLDACYLSSYSTAYMDYGKGSDCGNPRYRYYAYFYDSQSTTVGHRIYGSCYYGPAFGKAFAVIGLDKAPGGGLPIGPDAKLYIHPGRILAVKGPYNLNYYGYTYISSSNPILTIPGNPQVLGMKLYCQFVALDSGYKNIYSTHGRIMQLPLWSTTTGKTLSVSYVYRTGSSALTSPTGYKRTNSGVITQFGF